MKYLRAALLMLLPLVAVAQSPFTLYIHDTTGTNPDFPLPSIYQLASTAVGTATPTVIKAVNTSTQAVTLGDVVVSTSADSLAPNPNFSVTNFAAILIPAGQSIIFSVNFAPTTTGVITGYLNLDYEPQGASAGVITNTSVMNGTATMASLLLSYQGPSGLVPLYPSTLGGTNYLVFPDTPLSAQNTYTFVLTNPTSISVASPTISMTDESEAGAFSVNASSVPTAVAAGQKASFTVTFAPSQPTSAAADLQLQYSSFTNYYPMQGLGYAVSSNPIDTLFITYMPPPPLPQNRVEAPTAIPFGLVLPGNGGSVTYTFGIVNPDTSSGPATIPAITVSGAGFTVSNFSAGGLTPTFPVTLPLSTGPASTATAPQLTFNVTFTPTSVGSFSGTLVIGTGTSSRTFSLTGSSGAGLLPSMSLSTTGGPLASQQQLNLVVTLGSPSPVTALGTVSMKFTPTVIGVSDDSAVSFVATAGRFLNINVAAGAQNATYGSGSGAQSAIPFQTGTTAGNIVFSVSFPDTATYSQTFTINPVAPQLTTVEAVRESPNLVVNVSGFDNAYSAGQLSFTFYDTSGNVIGSPIPYNAAGNFQTLFFTNNSYGGLFSLQATFPVTAGSVTQVGSVTVGVANSVGQSTGSAAFQ